MGAVVSYSQGSLTTSMVSACAPYIHNYVYMHNDSSDSYKDNRCLKIIGILIGCFAIGIGWPVPCDCAKLHNLNCMI